MIGLGVYRRGGGVAVTSLVMFSEFGGGVGVMRFGVLYLRGDRGVGVMGLAVLYRRGGVDVTAFVMFSEFGGGVGVMRFGLL